MRLFLWDYEKEGPGVSKNALPKEGVELILDIFRREFTSLIKLNLIFIISCIPIITIGAAIGAMTAVTVKMVQDKPTDLTYEFREALKKNWKVSSLWGILAVIVLLLLGKMIDFCLLSGGIIYSIAVSFLIVASILLGIFSVYIYPMSVSIKLPLSLIIKNSFLLSIIHIKYSLLTFLLCIALIEITFIFFPITLFIVFLFLFSFINFLSSFCAWSGIRKFIIKDQKTLI